jgi:hypothetical protein
MDRGKLLMSEDARVRAHGDGFDVTLSNSELVCVISCLVYALEQIPAYEFGSRFGIDYADAERLLGSLNQGWRSLMSPVDTFARDVDQAFAFLGELGFRAANRITGDHGWASAEYVSPEVIFTVTQENWSRVEASIARRENPDLRVPLRAFMPPDRQLPKPPPVKFWGARDRALTRLAQLAQEYAADALRGDEARFRLALGRVRERAGEADEHDF